ncbi:MAG: AtpZ/AtpI family protein [Bacillota bacterium]
MEKDYWKYAKYANFALSFGVTMAVSLFLGFYAGSQLDKKLGTEPWFLIVGLLLGTGLAFYSLFKEIQVLLKQSEKTEKNRGED